MDTIEDYSVSDRKGLVRVARKKEPPDVFFQGGHILNVFTGELLPRGMAVKNGRIACLPKETDPYVKLSPEVYDLEGSILVPGFIDAHVHIESSMLTPAQFASAVLTRGTTAVVYDPHEIANVLGVPGVEWMVKDIGRAPLKGFLAIPSCVPASGEGLETSGASFGPQEIKKLSSLPEAIALGEMMNYPGVLDEDEGVFEFLTLAAESELNLEGHASGLTGTDLSAYSAAGIDSDHEAAAKDESIQRVRRGMWTYIREGSGWRDLEQVIRPITEEGVSSRRFCLVTDDRDPVDLLEEGGMDHVVRRAVEEGLSPIQAIQMATLNPAQRFGLDGNLGSLSPGRVADFSILNSLDELRIERTFVEGRPQDELQWSGSTDEGVRGTVDLGRSIEEMDFDIGHFTGSYGIGVHENSIMTDLVDIDESANPEVLTRCAVIERHRGSGRIGRALIDGFGLQEGAVGSTVAHDSHNLIVLGVSPGDMVKAANHLRQLGGGIVVVRDETVQAQVELPVAGLMAPFPPSQVAESLEALHSAIRSLGVELSRPVMTISSLALPVIPEARVTDKGLVDVKKGRVID